MKGIHNVIKRVRYMSINGNGSESRRQRGSPLVVVSIEHNNPIQSWITMEHVLFNGFEFGSKAI